MATQRPWSNRSTRCAREINGCAIRTSARRSRPTTTSLPGAKVRVDPSYRTVSAGGAGRLIATNSIGRSRECGAGPTVVMSRHRHGMHHRAVSVIWCNAAMRSPRVVMTWANAASTDGVAVARRAPVPADARRRDRRRPRGIRPDRRACRRASRCDPTRRRSCRPGRWCSPPTPCGMPALTVPTKSSASRANSAFGVGVGRWRRRSVVRRRWGWTWEMTRCLQASIRE